MMENCLFCKIAKKELSANIVYEDKDIIAFLDISPINPGHTLVVPKKHSENIYGMDEATLKKASVAIKRVAIAVKKGTNADGINIGMNNESFAGQVIMHSHFHIIPRFAKDNLTDWPGKDISKKKLEQIEEKIKKSF